MPTPKPLEIVDIMTSMFNQEKLVERMLAGIFESTTTPFNLIVVFDGCTDRTEEIGRAYIKKHRPPLLRSVAITTAPNVFELKANNIGYSFVTSPYVIYVQDDVLVQEKGWERRLTYPLRIYDDVWAVGSRMAMNMLVREGAPQPDYYDLVAREYFTLPRSTFAIRQTVNNGPMAYRTDILKKLNYLDERYYPGALCDNDITLRASRDFGLKCGALWIDYRSDIEWGKTRSKESTMNAYSSYPRSTRILLEQHPYLATRASRVFENRHIYDWQIDYVSRDPYVVFWYKRLGGAWRHAKVLVGRKWHALKVRISRMRGK